MKTHDEVVSDLDLFAEDVRANPYAHYRTLRDQGRAVYLSKLEMWAIPHYADVRSGLRDWSHLTSSRGVVFNERGNNAEVKRVNMIATDPPRHAELRAVIAKRVSPGVLRPAGEYIEHRADQTARSTGRCNEAVRVTLRERPRETTRARYSVVCGSA